MHIQGPPHPLPDPPQGADWVHVGAGVPVWACPYVLRPKIVSGQHPHFSAAPGWQPRPDLGLDAALPFPWDDSYTIRYRQPFQPVKLWRNAIALSLVLERRPEADIARRTLHIAEALLARMWLYTSQNAGVAWLESRFAFTLPDRSVIPAPWVSGIANAFAILACLRLRKHLDTAAAAQAFARAYVTVQDANTPVMDRWISYRDPHGHIWFEEYPRPEGQSTRVQNGHVFATLALHEMALVFEGEGYDGLARAGATTLAAYAARFRQPGRSPLYALDLAGAPDYLPQRAMRQMYQLYEMTGEARFLHMGDCFVEDGRAGLDPATARSLQESRARAILRRAKLQGAQP